MRTHRCCHACRALPGTCLRKWACPCHADKGAWTDPDIDGTAKGYDYRVTDHRTRLEERKA